MNASVESRAEVGIFPGMVGEGDSTGPFVPVLGPELGSLVHGRIEDTTSEEAIEQLNKFAAKLREAGIHGLVEVGTVMLRFPRDGYGSVTNRYSKVSAFLGVRDPLLDTNS